MRVLFAAYEAAPLFKKGGLGDVVGSLPKAVREFGVTPGIVLPYYDAIQVGHKRKIGMLSVLLKGKEERVDIFETYFPGTSIPTYLFSNRHFNNIQNDTRQFEQFAFFSKAVAEFIVQSKHILHSSFDIIHLHDWHVALVPLFLHNKRLSGQPKLPKTLLTIHNFGYQAIAPVSILKDLGISPHADRVVAWDTRDGTFEFLKEGIVHTDFVSTVSPTYREEILDPKLSGKLAEVAEGKEGRISGILNGIDYTLFNPATDPYLTTHYYYGDRVPRVYARLDLISWETGKRINKRDIQKRAGLPILVDIPLFSFVGRIEPTQKGIDIFVHALEDMLGKIPMQIIVLGTGEIEWSEQIHRLVGKHKTKAAFLNLFDEGLARLLYAGSDFVIIPSRYEPCGLVQMIAMRYGAIPIVRKTGGLADTVVDKKTGFVFEDYSALALERAIKRALTLYSQDKDMMQKMIRMCFAQDFSWEKSAKAYVRLYKKMLRE